MVGRVQVRLLTEKGFSYVMLHSSNATVRAITCAGMNETRLVAAAADLQRPARAFGVSAAGELVALSLAGQNRISSCRVRFKRDVHMTMPAPNMAVLQAGALVTAANSLHLFNTTSSTKGARHAVLQQQLAQLPRCASCRVNIFAVAATLRCRVCVCGYSVKCIPTACMCLMVPAMCRECVACTAGCTFTVWYCWFAFATVALKFPGLAWHAGASVFLRCLS